jgi:hypothetical protein
MISIAQILGHHAAEVVMIAQPKPAPPVRVTINVPKAVVSLRVKKAASFKNALARHGKSAPSMVRPAAKVAVKNKVVPLKIAKSDETNRKESDIVWVVEAPLSVPIKPTPELLVMTPAAQHNRHVEVEKLTKKIAIERAKGAATAKFSLPDTIFSSAGFEISSHEHGLSLLIENANEESRALINEHKPALAASLRAKSLPLKDVNYI